VIGNPHLSLTDLAKSFKWLGMEIDLDEIECILANLIYRGYIRGYISHTRRTLVLSKSNPFPTSAIIVPATSA
jgi:nuclear mRNA export protein PCID2/THP1